MSLNIATKENENTVLMFFTSSSTPMCIIVSDYTPRHSAHCALWQKLGVNILTLAGCFISMHAWYARWRCSASNAAPESVCIYSSEQFSLSPSPLGITDTFFFPSLHACPTFTLFLSNNSLCQSCTHTHTHTHIYKRKTIRIVLPSASYTLCH